MTERNRRLALRAHRILRRLTFCAYCRGKGDRLLGPDGRPWEIDHVVPLALGGADELWNMVKSCSTCNRDKGADRWVQLTRGLATAATVKRAMDGRRTSKGLAQTVAIPKSATERERVASAQDARWERREQGWEREFRLLERRGGFSPRACEPAHKEPPWRPGPGS